MAQLLSVNVGLPRDIEWKGRTVRTAIWKDPVRGRCRVGRLNLEGDRQGDLAGRIGDRYQIGSALFEVTQPRVTCYRIGIRMNEVRMPALLTGSGRPGFYLRVLQEGEVGASDEIVKVGEAKERMTVAEINALLYSPNHARDRLESALRIDALSPGWRSSFQALLQSHTTAAGGNAGLVPAAAARPVPAGFRPLTVTAIDQECADVFSLTLQSPADPPLPAALPGQYVVLRLQPTAAGSPLFRSYSLSGPVSRERYRISVKMEPNGAAGTYLKDHVRVGDVLDVSAPRGSFVLQSGERPIVLLSAGIGATPVLAMLQALSAAGSKQQILWLYGARDRQHHPFAADVRRLMLGLIHGRSYICYSTPGTGDTMAQDFDATGHLSRSVFDEVGVPREADVYLCGPARFMVDMKEALAMLGVAPGRIHVEIFNGGESLTPGVVGAVTRISASARARRHRRRPGVVRAQRDCRALERDRLPEPPGAGRGVRRPGPLVVPDRCVSQLREWSGFRCGRLRTGATRQTRRGQPSRVLLSADPQRRH